jgi:gluconate kinase
VVFIITGSTESGRDTVGKHLADTLGWEFVNAENLRPTGNMDANRCGDSRANAGPMWLIEALSAAIDIWIYEWRDVVVLCPLLMEADGKRLCQKSSLVKIVRLESSLATGRAHVLDQSADVGSQLQARWYGSQDQRRDVLTVDTSRQVEEIVAEMTAVLLSPVVAKRD